VRAKSPTIGASAVGRPGAGVAGDRRTGDPRFDEWPAESAARQIGSFEIEDLRVAALRVARNGNELLRSGLPATSANGETIDLVKLRSKEKSQ
jgi:hypothetical protein